MIFRKLRKKLDKKKVASFLIAAEIITMLSTVTACGTSEAEVPELKEPVTSISTYRPVTRMTVGALKNLYGQVVPAEYPCFSEKQVALSSIEVGIGDYVEKGTVVAKAVTSNEEIDGIRFELDSLQRRKEMILSTSEKTIEKLNYEKSVEEFLGDEEGIQEKNKAIATELENKRYELALIEKKTSIHNNNLAELQGKNDEKTFVASHSGYVTFVKDISKDNHVEGSESIVVISDYDEQYIEVKGLPIDKYDYTDYKNKWLMMDGKRIPIKEREYTTKEVSYADAVKMKPNVSFVTDGTKLPMGADVVLYFIKEKKMEGLAVGNDSLYQDNGESYVYVKGSGEKDEIRKVELGETDGLYTEVKSGLEEGELVFYKNRAMIPTKQEIVTASLTDYEEETTSKIVEKGMPYKDIYLSEIEGKFERILDIGYATAGDPLFSVKSAKGAGDVESIRVAISNLNSEREKQIKEYQKTREEIKAAIEESLFGQEKTFISNGNIEQNQEGLATDTDAIRANMYKTERLQCDLALLDYNDEYNEKEYIANKKQLEKEYTEVKKGVGDEGLITNAKKYGKLEGGAPQNDIVVYKDSFIITMETAQNTNNMLYAVSPEGGAKIGIKGKFKNKDNVWTGRCIGVNGEAERYNLFTRNGKQYVTYSAPYGRNVEFQMYFEMDKDIDDAAFENTEMTYDSFFAKGVVVIPSVSVKTEVSEISGIEKKFVWKQENGELVKEYVTIHKTDVSNGKAYIISGVEAGDKILK